MEPGVDTVGVTQAADVSPGSDECLLDRVGCEVAIAEDEAGDRVQPREGAGRERGERVVVAASRLFDKVSPHQRHPLYAIESTALSQGRAISPGRWFHRAASGTIRTCSNGPRCLRGLA